MATPTFNDDIMPFLYPWRAQMLWRLDLTKYEDVKANAEVIYGQISGETGQMPPPPFDPLTSEQISAFKSWMDGGYPEG